MRYAEVAVDAPVGHERTFTYSIPSSLNVRVGQLVRVPFGPRALQGFVVALTPQTAVAETRDIYSAPDDGPTLTDVQMRLARWTSDYYMCSLFEAAALMLPPGGRVRHKTYVTLATGAANSQPVRMTPHQERVLEYIRGHSGVEEGRLLEALGRGTRAAVRRLSEVGLVIRSHRWAGQAVGRKTREYVQLAPLADQKETDGNTELVRRWPRRAALLSHLEEAGVPIAISEARKEHGASAVNTLLKQGLIVVDTVAEDRDPLSGFSLPPPQPVTLTSSQEKAASAIGAALVDPSTSPRVFLVEGVTGSGKTEIYIDAVRRCLGLGKRAIVLVPEIALTHQTIERFAAKFPGNVAVLHSGLKPGQRFDQWWKTQAGKYGLVIGSRGAIFAPQPALGLIVIDEEHEWTYKQHDSAPRYHARDVALRLAELTGSVVVLGSASPDVQSYYKALKGRFRLLRLPHRVARIEGSGPARVGTSELASVEVVDMRRELREGHRLMFSRPLLRHMGESLEAGSQVVLFLNRRGSASFMQCRRCGFSLRCRRCDIPVTYHRDADRLLCHYCGDRRIPPSRCPQCLDYRMSYRGAGTQAVVDEVVRRFPGVGVLRWDRDSARRPGEHQQLLESFRSGEAQVLVGTQMIAKGLHFPAVTVVGAVSADVGLNIPDYRAGERAFQLLCQVAGRSGRGPSKGKVVIQTYQPDSYAITAAAAQDYGRFYAEEISHRREQGNPPINRLIRLLYAHTNRAMCEREARRFSAQLGQERDSWGYSDVEVLGPTPAYPARLRGQYRWQLLLRGPNPRTLLDKVAVPPSWVIDVDPVGLS